MNITRLKKIVQEKNNHKQKSIDVIDVFYYSEQTKSINIKLSIFLPIFVAFIIIK